MAVSMMVNAQHLMYREDILADLGIEVPASYDDVLAAAETIKEAGVVDYPLGGTYQSGWNLAQEFVNMYFGFGGEFVDDAGQPTLNNENGVAALEMMKRLTDYMDPNIWSPIRPTSSSSCSRARSPWPISGAAGQGPWTTKVKARSSAR